MDDKGGNFYKPQEEETKWQGFKRVVWNTDTGEFFGRTGLSWFKITLFYIIFYACLAAFWTCMLVVFYQTLNEREPKWKLDGSRIGTSPGLGFRPSPPENNVDSTLIWFNSSRNSTLNYWVTNVNDFLKPYHQQALGEKVKNCQEEDQATMDSVCYFPIPKGKEHPCTAERHYGYPEGKPCVLIKLNRIFGWLPEKYESVPEELSPLLAGEYNPKRVYITCIGENAADKDNIGNVEYHPEQGIPFKYFPFLNQDSKEHDVYVSPFVFVQFSNINRNVLVSVECRAWANNINFDRGDRLGSVHFELLVD